MTLLPFLGLISLGPTYSTDRGERFLARAIAALNSVSDSLSTSLHLEKCPQSATQHNPFLSEKFKDGEIHTCCSLGLLHNLPGSLFP